MKVTIGSERWHGRPYSAATRFGDLVFSSGFTGVDPETGRVPAGIEAQTRQSLDNLSEVLKMAGSSLENALKVNVFLTDIADYQAMNKVYREYFFEDLPARACVEVKGLSTPEKRIEIEVIAFATE